LDQIRETIIQAPVEVDSQNFGKSFNVLYWFWLWYSQDYGDEGTKAI
jgi:hypothetical protein